MDKTLVVPRRFNGPPESGNGGWTSGAVAALLSPGPGGAVQVRLAAPPPLDVELTTIANWCAAHGLAELCLSTEFDDMKKQLGGDEAFFEAVLSHLGGAAGET